MKKLDNFTSSLNVLKNADFNLVHENEIYRMGVIGQFNLTFELAWKLMKAVLEEHGRFQQKIGSPRVIIKTAYQCGMISDCDGWLELLETRNLLAHTYSDEQALKAIRDIKVSYLSLFELLKREIDENWTVETDGASI